ncbi:Probable inactive receptor kinase At1g48480 [Linum perenne]
MKPLLLFFFLLAAVVNSDLASDRAALVGLRNGVGGRSLLWNMTDSPCNWVGVICAGNRVVELHLPGMGLSGELPIGLGNLTQLLTLSVRFNALRGSVPADIANLSLLRNLYLQGNFFSGEIPAFLFPLQNLVRLNLADNNFSGPISNDFNKLTRLRTLYLEGNQLTGPIPDINVPPLDQFNVSSNNLTGPIPASLAGKPATAFLENSQLCGKPLVSCNGTASSGGGGGKLSGGAIAGIVIGCVIGFLLLLLILFFLCRRRKTTREVSNKDVEQTREIENPSSAENGKANSAAVPAAAAAAAAVAAKADAKGMSSKSLVFFGNTPRTFDLEDLLRASAEVLGKGTFGTTYKATLEMGVVMAVKRLKEVIVSEKEYREKIEVVGKMNDENLVMLKAYYFSKDEKLLVYEYMSMGSLSALLHGNRGAGRTPLNWDKRSTIALGAAKGISYLHSQGSSISHGNIKSSNILLTKSYEARVSDFGLAQLAGAAPNTSRVDGYRAPEVTDAHKVSQKADVYSFGVLLLELLTGKAPTHSLTNDEGVDLPRWVQSVVREEWTAEVFDLELLRYQNVEEEMVELLQLAIDCTAQYPDKRPAMTEVTRRIEEICRSSSSENGGIVVDEASVDSGAPASG